MSKLSKVNSNIAINMGKRCVAAGCSNMNGDGVSLFRFPRDPALRAQWNKQVQRTPEPIGRVQLSIPSFVASILQANALKRTPL